ncbi:hypothetical protein AB0I81_45065 [Nonomuraea sp. NPDC050404]|uniref:hypothetical protein n=1 Tax=Nonomuraea sp. NPDC050404 TaxID=3155783 RepID=UPI0033DEFAD2
MTRRAGHDAGPPSGPGRWRRVLLALALIAVVAVAVALGAVSFLLINASPSAQVLP